MRNFIDIVTLTEGEVIPFPKRMGPGDLVTYTDAFFRRFPTMPKTRVGKVTKIYTRDDGRTFVMVAWDDGGRSGWESKYIRLARETQETGE